MMEELKPSESEVIQIRIGSQNVTGDLSLIDGATGIVLFAHGSGSGRHSPRNRFVASALQYSGLSTLLVDLLTPEAEQEDQAGGNLRFNIRLLADRLVT